MAVLKAQYRQVNHERARLMATMVETGLCDTGPDDRVRRVERPDEFAPDEIRAALVLTRRAAEHQFWTAYDLCTRLPAVHTALDTGLLDEPRARIFAEWSTDLTDEQARTLCAGLLPRAPGLTTGQLIELLKKHAIALDPDWARRRYERALTDRRIVGSRNPDGTANLSGYNLPVERVAAASGRIDTLARSAKNAGDTRPIDHIRAELFLGMTDGTYTGLHDTTILHHLRAAAGESADQPPADTDPDTDAESTTPGSTGAADPTEPAEGPAPRPRRRGGLELRVRLSTLLGHDEHPGELAGWGPVHATLARTLTTTLRGAQWRYAITGPTGHLLHAGITRHRPTHAPRGTGGGGGGGHNIVELQIPATLLDALAHDPPAAGPWAAVVADLARQHATTTADPYTSDADRRAPGAALRRHLQIRDRTCIGPGCRAPARTADQDHTRDHAHGGITTDTNLGGACKHDHRLKHDGGWRLEQPQPGHFRWTSRLGHHYDTKPAPIIEPLPDPQPVERPPDRPTPRVDDGEPIWAEPPPEPPEPPPPEPDPTDDPPPF